MVRADFTAATPTDITQRIEELEGLLLRANDAAFGLAGILSAVLIETGAISRDGLADLIRHRAGPAGDPDHNALLDAFGRALRANFPGGRFEVIEGGKPRIASR